MDKPLSNNKPGRPPTPETTLAASLNVSPRTVKRWTSNPDAIQSCDENADKLAETAHSYDPEKTTEIPLEDVRLHPASRRRMADEEANTLTCPCPRIHECPHIPRHQKLENILTALEIRKIQEGFENCIPPRPRGLACAGGRVYE